MTAIVGNNAALLLVIIALSAIFVKPLSRTLFSFDAIFVALNTVSSKISRPSIIASPLICTSTKVADLSQVASNM